jgi:hypothetical protein
MLGLENKDIQCPYCWEWITVQVDCSVSRQQYVEDCQVCCQPILLTLQIDAEGWISADARPENE